MSRKRFHGLWGMKKSKVRQSWNKFNLFNLSRLRIRIDDNATAYQQRWRAKSMTRAYHGEHIREKQWQRMFRSRMQAVVPMDHKYLAENDGSELASGRGSGREKLSLPDAKDKDRPAQIPYMNMVYAPIERRLDMAVWRALFASSARQARQFVIHGNVKVNGQKMPYPGYLLNPGDMFQVDVDRVMFATGAPKQIQQVRAGRKLRKMLRRRAKDTKPQRLGLKAKKELARQQGKEIEEKAQTGGQEPASSGWQDVELVREQRKQDFGRLLTQVEDTFNDSRNKPSAKQKIELRALRKDILSSMRKVNQKTVKTLDTELNDLLARMSITSNAQKAQASMETLERDSQPTDLTEKKIQALREAMAREAENPVDDSKPYATPWTPRPYMSAFAFIPRYLEVNHNICSAVYLRHPVARPRLAEVPSPFPTEIQQLAFNWYLRRR